MFFIFCLFLFFNNIVNGQICPSLGITSGQDTAGPCSCDLSNICDVNCCCDSTCQVEVFSQCDQRTILISQDLCFWNVKSYNNNLEYNYVVYNQHLSCIYTNNYYSSIYFDVPATICTNEVINMISKPYSFINEINVENSNKIYKYGDKIYTVYQTTKPNNIGVLSLPLIDGLCSPNPLRFLKNAKATCSLITSQELARQCQTNKKLNANFYYKNFKVINNYQNDTAYNMTDSNLIELKPSIVRCMNSVGVFNPCIFGINSIPSPSLTALSCNNIVVGVTYNIAYDSTIGIKSIFVDFILKNFTFSSNILKSVSQSFEVNYFQEELKTKWSGNPGYIIGQPIMAGYEVTNSSETNFLEINALNVNSDNNLWFSMASPGDALGMCSDFSRVPILFGQNMRSGCSIRFTYNNISNICVETSNYLRDVTLPGMYPPLYVAEYGNSPTYNVSQGWIKIEDNKGSLGTVASNNIDGCSDFVTGLDIQITYQNTGSFASPQPKILKVFYAYKTQPDFRFLCIGEYCQGLTLNLPQAFEIVTSVTFIDASPPATAQNAEAKKSGVYLPPDFFSPLNI